MQKVVQLRIRSYCPKTHLITGISVFEIIMGINQSNWSLCNYLRSAYVRMKCPLGGQHFQTSFSAIFLIPPRKRRNMTYRLRHNRPPLWSSRQSYCLLTRRSRIRFPVLPHFLSSIGSGTGSIQPREHKRGVT
jgi:hypothetical protein